MTYYYDVYRKLLIKSWNNMEPMEYGALLITIALVGWFFMKSSLKR